MLNPAEIGESENFEFRVFVDEIGIVFERIPFFLGQSRFGTAGIHYYRVHETGQMGSHGGQMTAIRKPSVKRPGYDLFFHSFA